LSLLLSQLHKTSGAQVWRGSVAATAATRILDFGWTFSWLWFGLSAWSLVILSSCDSLRERCATLVGHWYASRIIISIKVKVLEGGLCAYGWVIILLYCLSKNEHIPLFIIGYGPTLSSDILTTGIYIGKLFVKLVMAPVTTASSFSDYAAATNPNPCVRALMMKRLT
jgi:hypothetical protein